MKLTSTPPPPEAVPSPPIDPRIRARRIEVARDTGRRRLRRLLVVIACAVAAGAAWGMTRTPLLDVDRIEVEGAHRSSVAGVAAATGVAVGDAMTSVDRAAAEAAVTSLPWVSGASVRRVWPGTVRVLVEEWEPAGAVALGQDRGWMLVSASGHQLAPVAEVPPGVLVVDGVPGAGEPGSQLEAAEAPLQVAEAVPGALAAEVVAVRVERGGELHATVVVAGGGEVAVRLGPAVDLGEKLLALAALVDHADLDGVDSVDVRVPASPVLTRGEPHE